MIVLYTVPITLPTDFVVTLDLIMVSNFTRNKWDLYTLIWLQNITYNNLSTNFMQWLVRWTSDLEVGGSSPTEILKFI